MNGLAWNRRSSRTLLHTNPWGTFEDSLEPRPHKRGVSVCTAELLADPEFHRPVRVLEFALYSRPIMSGEEVALLLGD